MAFLEQRVRFYHSSFFLIAHNPVHSFVHFYFFHERKYPSFYSHFQLLFVQPFPASKSIHSGFGVIPVSSLQNVFSTYQVHLLVYIQVFPKGL